MIPANLIQLQLPLRLCSVAALSRYQDPGTGFRGAWFVWPTRSLGLIMPCHAIPCRCPFNSRYLAIRMPVTRYSFHNSRQHCSLTVSSIQFHRRRVQSSTPHRAAAIRDPLSRQSIRLRYPNGWASRGGAAEHGAAGGCMVGCSPDTTTLPIDHLRTCLCQRYPTAASETS